MTSSDATLIDQGAVDAVARRVAASYDVAADRSAQVAVVCARFNGGVTLRLLHGVLDALDQHGPGSHTATVAWVPGAFELPLAAQCLARSGTVDAVVALGAVIRGDTPHFDFVAGPCAQGLSRVALETSVPVVFGVLTTETEAQAFERCEPGPTNKGYEAAMTALAMVGLLGQIAGQATARSAGEGRTRTAVQPTARGAICDPAQIAGQATARGAIEGGPRTPRSASAPVGRGG